MSSPAPLYDSFIDYYEARRASAIVEIQRPRRFGAMLMARQTAGDWSDPPTPELGFSIITSGIGTYSADLGAGRFRSKTRPGETIMVAPGGGTSIQRDSAHAIISYSFPYTDLLAMLGDDATLPPDGDFGALHSAPLKDKLVPTLLQRLWQEASRPDPSYAILQEGALITIAALLTGADKAAPAASGRNALAPWQSSRAIAMMQDNLHRDLPLRELAGEIRLSPYHFARAFKATVGMPPGRYHQMLRIDHAKQLLLTTDLPVSAVAAAVGYADPSYLARIFRRDSGDSPDGFRRRSRAWRNVRK